jgi:hypothetical protein
VLHVSGDLGFTSPPLPTPPSLGGGEAARRSPGAGRESNPHGESPQPVGGPKPAPGSLPRPGRRSALDVVVPCLPHLLLEVELVAWDRRRSLPGPARPKENDPSSAPMQLGEASRSGFVFVDERVENAGHGAPGVVPFRPVIPPPNRPLRSGIGNLTTDRDENITALTLI